MSRTLRILGVAFATVAVAGLVSTAAMACPATDQANAKTAKSEMTYASGSYCSVSALSACSAGAKLSGGCCAETAASMAKLAPFSFVNTAKEQNVAVGVQSLDNGFAFVFAGGTEASIANAKVLATNSAASLGKPAACSYTRGAMAKAAGGCASTEACLSALADSNIEVVETENGAVAKISSKDEAKVAELHTFVKSFAQATPEKDSDS